MFLNTDENTKNKINFKIRKILIIPYTDWIYSQFKKHTVAWIWNIADKYFPNAVKIVDIMHAKSHLYNAAKVAFTETEQRR